MLSSGPSSRCSFFPLVIAILLFCSTSAHAARLAKRDESNFFINPPSSGPNGDFNDNLNFNLGSVIDLGWITDYGSVSLQLCQQNPDLSAACYPLFREQLNVQSVQWTVGLGSSGFSLATNASE
jgi:hypothetical protein